MKYAVGTLREAGLEAKWTKTRYGAPIIIARMPGVGGGRWYAVDTHCWSRMLKVGVREGFEQVNLLGEVFSG